MDVGIRELRADLSRWVKRAAGGEEVVVTDRGKAVARLVPMNGESTFDRLVREGVIIPAPNKGPRTRAEPIEGRAPSATSCSRIAADRIPRHVGLRQARRARSRLARDSHGVDRSRPRRLLSPSVSGGASGGRASSTNAPAAGQSISTSPHAPRAILARRRQDRADGSALGFAIVSLTD
jgi:prevent-host-death family protein